MTFSTDITLLLCGASGKLGTDISAKKLTRPVTQH
jgi:hypothetical protein